MMTRPRLLWLLPILAAAFMLARTEFKSGPRMFDFAVHYAAAHAWVQGSDPYDMSQLSDQWRDAGGSRGARDMTAFQRSNLPPCTLVAVAPVTIFSPNVAAEVWTWLSILLAGAAALAAADLARRSLPDPSKGTAIPPILLAATLASGPVLSGLLVGQVTVPASSLAVLGVWLHSARRRPVAAGLLIGLASCLKPPVAIAFFAYYLWRRPWTAFAVATLVLIVTTSLGIACLSATTPDWFAHWVGNMSSGFVPGAVNDYAANNPTRDHLVQIQTLLNAPLHANRPLVTAAAFLITITLGLTWAALSRRPDMSPLLSLATITSLALLPVYHRYYDLTAPIILTLAWSLSHWHIPHARLTALLLTPFLLPVGWQTNLVNHHLLPPHTAQSWWWHSLVEPINATLLLALCLTLLAAMLSTPASERSEDPDSFPRPT